MARARRSALLLCSALAAGCAGAPSSPDGGTTTTTTSASLPPGPEAGFVDAPARDVVLHDKPVHVEARARLFYNLWPAADKPEEKPIFFIFNGFASEIVRAFGTGPETVADGGAVVDNSSPLTEMANLVYVDPRQSGFSYDVVDGGKPTIADCGASVFNEYVDAADVLFAALAILEKHPELRGPVHWVGESYGGVRIQWILAYLRGRWDLAPYDDPALKDAISHSNRGPKLRAGQVLLSPWLVGSAHAAAISDYCVASEAIAAVSAAAGMPCGAQNACTCADTLGRSRYNFDYSTEHQDAREFEASAAHVKLDDASRLFGVPLTKIPDLAATERRKGFKCDTADKSTPDETELVGALGELQAGQSYFLAYNPLQPGKELEASSPDWFHEDLEGPAFVDNLRDVPALAAYGERDLVVPGPALAPALAAAIGAARVDTSAAPSLEITYPDGSRTIEIHTYPAAGHMITMIEPAAFAHDLGAWLAAH